MDRANEKQKQAIRTTEGHVLILAGPGTGKTRTLVQRTAYLIREKGVLPNEITVTTFTRKATQEVVVRLSRLLADAGRAQDAGKVHVGNFHHLAGAIVEKAADRAGFGPGVKPLNDMAKQALVTAHLSSFRTIPDIEMLGIALSPEVPGAVSAWCRLFDQLREGFVDFRPQDAATTAAKAALQEYRQLLMRHNVMDFSEMLFSAYFLLKQNPDILLAEQKKCRYLMVDEYQDTNPIQEQILRLLQEKSGNLCVVGDSDQSLYRFRGASVHNLLSFADRYADTTVIRLEENYRSDGIILDRAERAFRCDVQTMSSAAPTALLREEKTLFPADPMRHHDAAVQQLFCADASIWAERIADSLLILHAQGMPYADMAILSFSVRSPMMITLAQTLQKRGIPVNMPRGGTLMADRDVRRFLGGLTLVFRPFLKQAMDERLLTRSTLDPFVAYAMSIPKRDFAEQEKYAKAFRKRLAEGETIVFLDLCYGLLGVSPFNAMIKKALCNDVGAEAHLGAVRNALTDLLAMLAVDPESESLLTKDNIVRQSAILFGRWLPLLNRTKQPALREEQETDISDALSLFTIHQSKGLEYSVVFLVESAPRSAFMSRSGIARLTRSPALGEPLSPGIAERMDHARLMYTARTRAKSLLVETGIRYGKDDPALSAQTVQSCVFLPSDPVPASHRYAFTSDIACYRRCPRQYYFLRKMQMPTKSSRAADRGTLVHESLARYYRFLVEQGKKPTDETVLSMVQLVRKGMERAGAELDADDGECAEKQVLALHRAEPFLPTQITGVEQEVHALLDHHVLEGKMDLVVEDGKWIVDFKTARPTPEQENVYRDQLRFYRCLLSPTRDEGMKETSAETTASQMLYYTAVQEAEHPRDEFSFPIGEREPFLQEIRETVAAIEQGDFSVRTENQTHCRTCPMRECCP
ncbi:ATP-dependent helicase [Murdochiella sp. Marseille-P8839]|nr:ATP-dependent helicase [Murdochiella sp. Marseille-P8839]